MNYLTDDKQKTVSHRALARALVHAVRRALVSVRRLKQQDEYCLPLIEDMANTFADVLDTTPLSSEKQSKTLAHMFTLIATNQSRRNEGDIPLAEIEAAAQRAVNGYKGQYNHLPHGFARALIGSYGAIKGSEFAKRQDVKDK